MGVWVGVGVPQYNRNKKNEKLDVNDVGLVEGFDLAFFKDLFKEEVIVGLLDFDFEFIEAADFSEEGGSGDDVTFLGGRVSDDSEHRAFNGGGHGFIGSIFSEGDGFEPELGGGFIFPTGAGAA